MERTPFLIWPEANSRMASSGDCADERIGVIESTRIAAQIGVSEDCDMDVHSSQSIGVATRASK